MREFPLSKDEWYAKRDNRTHACQGLSEFDNYKVGLVINRQSLNQFKNQVMVWVAGNILARWCRNITIQIDGDVLSILNGTKGNSFIESFKENLFKIDPHLNLQTSHIDHSVDAVLSIGANEIAVDDEKILWIDSDGWRSGYGIGRNPERTNAATDRNLLGASFAACLGNAELFRRATKKRSMQEPEVWISLFDFKKSTVLAQTKNSPYPEELDFGNIHQVGCGAVGSSFDYLLSLTNWKGRIDLIDFDLVDITNCNRSLPFLAWDGVDEMLKTAVCERILASASHIKTRAFVMDYAQFIKEGNYFKPVPDLILCLANAKGVWSNIQNNFPPLVYHATTTANWGVNFGRHIPKKEWCIMCRFGEESKKASSFIPPCSTGTLVDTPKEEDKIEGVLPFLSTISAILIVAELAKTAIQKYPWNKSFIQFSSKTPDGVFIQSQPMINEGCLCQGQEIKYYPHLITHTKYWECAIA